MLRRTVLPMVLAALLTLAACGGDGTEASDGADGPGTTVGDGLCELLGTEEIEDATGVGTTSADGDDDGCTWLLSESAAVIDGPNEDEDASLTVERIDPVDVDATSEAREIDVVDDLGDTAYVIRATDAEPAVLVVRDGDDALTLALTNVLDGGNATAAALEVLARTLLARL